MHTFFVNIHIISIYVYTFAFIKKTQKTLRDNETINGKDIYLFSCFVVTCLDWYFLVSSDNHRMKRNIGHQLTSKRINITCTTPTLYQYYRFLLWLRTDSVTFSVIGVDSKLHFLRQILTVSTYLWQRIRKTNIFPPKFYIKILKLFMLKNITWPQWQIAKCRSIIVSFRPI